MSSLLNRLGDPRLNSHPFMFFFPVLTRYVLIELLMSISYSPAIYLMLPFFFIVEFSGSMINDLSVPEEPILELLGAALLASDSKVTSSVS